MAAKKDPHGVPRERIPWFPKIDEEKCVSCGACVEFCHNGVYSDVDGKTVVSNPFGCVVGCTGCKSKCAEDAISFPDMKEFAELLRRIKREYAEERD